MKQAADRCLRKELSPFILEDIPPNTSQRVLWCSPLRGGASTDVSTQR